MASDNFHSTTVNNILLLKAINLSLLPLKRSIKVRLARIKKCGSILKKKLLSTSKKFSSKKQLSEWRLAQITSLWRTFNAHSSSNYFLNSKAS